MLDAFYLVRPVHGAAGAVADFAIVDANVPGAALLGATPGDLVGRPVTELLPALRESPLFAIGCEVLATGQRYEGEYQRRDPRTTAEWSRLQVVRTPEGLAVTARDITEAKRAAQALADLAVHDELTGLLNRRGFRQLATHEMRVGRRERRHDALLCLDLNGFKAVNDTWGHAAGDQVLQVVGRVLRETLRESDVSARLGGDEFAVYAPALHDGHDGHVVAARIWAALDAENAIAAAAGRPYAIHVGIGVSEVMPGDDLDALLARADAALYANKASHRGACRS
jgi:diguanylate cyclase (GGDEF)-like protein